LGKSKSYREGPAFTARNTPGADPKVSKGPVVKAEGTHMSGGATMRSGKTGNKGKSGKHSAKSGIYGQS